MLGERRPGAARASSAGVDCGPQPGNISGSEAQEGGCALSVRLR